MRPSRHDRIRQRFAEGQSELGNEEERADHERAQEEADEPEDRDDGMFPTLYMAPGDASYSFLAR